MKKPNAISKATIDRLPLYFRTLRLLQDEGRDIISSDELGRRLGITPEQIRKDLASFGQFGKKGVGYYVDQDPNVIGRTVNHVKVEDVRRLKAIVKERNIQIGIIAVPAAFAQGVADLLVDAGVKGIWNFAPIKMKVPETMHIVNEDLSVGLSTLSYHITRM